MNNAKLEHNYRAKSLCRLFETHKKDGNEYISCRNVQRFKQCPCQQYKYDSEKYKLLLDMIKNEDIAIWTSK